MSKKKKSEEGQYIVRTPKKNAVPFHKTKRGKRLKEYSK